MTGMSFQHSRGSIVTSSLLVLKDVVKWVLIFRKKSGQQNPMAVTLAKNIVFHYVLGGFTRCWDHPVGIDPNASSSHGFSRNGKKPDSFGEQSAQIARLGKKDKLSTAPANPSTGKKTKLVEFPSTFPKWFGEREPSFQNFLSPIYSFVITQFIFLGYNKKNFRISQQQRIETAHQVAREIFKPCHPQRPRHPQHATVETVALFNWWPPLPTSAAQTTYIHGGLPRSFNHHHCQSTIIMLAFENKPLFTTVTIVFVFCSEKPNWRVNNLANVSKKEFSVIWSSFNPKGCFSPLVSFPKLILRWIFWRAQTHPNAFQPSIKSKPPTLLAKK